jgi:hypothetical protein
LDDFAVSAYRDCHGAGVMFVTSMRPASRDAPRAGGMSFNVDSGEASSLCAPLTVLPGAAVM